jgi:hypothetical protein
MAAVLYAVRASNPPYKLSPTGTITVSDDGRTKFTASASGKHRFLLVDPAQKGAIQQTYVEIASAKPAPRAPRFPRRPVQQQEQQQQTPPPAQKKQ